MFLLKKPSLVYSSYFRDKEQDSFCMEPRESNGTRIRPGVYHTANGTFANDCQYQQIFITYHYSLLSVLINIKYTHIM